ncbi:hypothetical protein LXA43DRAFT_1143633 [Ganoderma leucocontextum]|nr:hypothetical protein LXA43DRAFT_1143633 [Ganoderma leucocontextum]
MATIPSSSTSMKLTYDTLLHVISLSRYAKDAVQLMATCRVLYHEGPKIALKKTVFISTAEQLASFFKFLRADNSSRCRYLRQLELRACSPDPDVVQELIETLPLLTGIEYLRLVEAEELLDLHPDLSPAFSALTNLRHINFSGVKGGTCALLLRLRSPLISANLSFVSDDDQKLWDYLDDDEWERCHPATLLDKFASTLEELQCLSIELHDFPLWVDAFIRACPTLPTSSSTPSSGILGEFNLRALQGSHDTNVGQQLRPVDSCGTWAHLEHFSGCLVDLYAIGLISHIHRVTIVDRLDDGPRTDILATVLRYARPLHLKLEGITGSMLGDADRGFISMLHEGSCSNLLNLDVCIHFGEDDREKDLSAVIDDLASALAGLPLKFLKLKFETYDLDPTLPGPRDFERMVYHQKGLPEPLTPAELSLMTLDTDALVARLESIPSLEAAHVVLPSSRYEGDWKGRERTITKGTWCLAGREQWQSWIPGKNRVGVVLKMRR